MGPLGKIAAFFSSNTSLHHGCGNNNAPSAKELKKAANAAQLAIRRRNKRNEWLYGEAGVPREVAVGAPLGGSSEDVRGRFSRRNPVWSSLRDLRSGRRGSSNVHADIPRNVKRAPDDAARHQNIIEEVVRGGRSTLPHKQNGVAVEDDGDVAPRNTLPHKTAKTLSKSPSRAFLAELFGRGGEAADEAGAETPPAAAGAGRAVQDRDQGPAAAPEQPAVGPAPPTRVQDTRETQDAEDTQGTRDPPAPCVADPPAPPPPQLVIGPALDPGYPRPTSGRILFCYSKGKRQLCEWERFPRFCPSLLLLLLLVVVVAVAAAAAAP
ncbi:hypothetical protein ONE63_004804 [Megalurothrips usitatus]|uniref:Uncharacterized protein n=1 Tax=Megalurothrips usitatus TaxID=439358 RepID=A0AAV7X4P8_9NEOP|nr:hypothetical protein ONE63_004804 [Megalurothrips usitatus]